MAFSYQHTPAVARMSRASLPNRLQKYLFPRERGVAQDFGNKCPLLFSCSLPSHPCWTVKFSPVQMDFDFISSCKASAQSRGALQVWPGLTFVAKVLESYSDAGSGRYVIISAHRAFAGLCRGDGCHRHHY